MYCFKQIITHESLPFSRNPTPEENHYLPTKWLPVTNDTLYYLNLGQELNLLQNPDEEIMKFWEDLYSKHFKIWEHTKINTIEPPRKLVYPDNEATEEQASIDDGQPSLEEKVVFEEIVPISSVLNPPVNGDAKSNADFKPKISNEIKMAQTSAPKDVVRASDPPEDDLPKNIGVNKFVNFYESLGGKK